jgi:hypothetical protein
MMQQAGMALQQRVPPTARGGGKPTSRPTCASTPRKWVPVAREKATKLAPAAPGRDPGREVHRGRAEAAGRHLESPVNRKYQALGGEMQKALAEKLVAEMRPTIEPKLQATAARWSAVGLAPAAPTASGRVGQVMQSDPQFGAADGDA